jgi:hypothetical protein
MKLMFEKQDIDFLMESIEEAISPHLNHSKPNDECFLQNCLLEIKETLEKKINERVNFADTSEDLELNKKLIRELQNTSNELKSQKETIKNYENVFQWLGHQDLMKGKGEENPLPIKTTDEIFKRIKKH